MNWQEIKEKYPKVENEISYWRLNGGRNISFDELYRRPRVLYDFFDEQRIYVLLERDYDFGKEEIYENAWNYEIQDIHKPIFISANGYPKTRTEAEEQAFLKAFEILEGRL